MNSCIHMNSTINAYTHKYTVQTPPYNMYRYKYTSKSIYYTCIHEYICTHVNIYTKCNMSVLGHGTKRKQNLGRITNKGETCHSVFSALAVLVTVCLLYQ